VFVNQLAGASRKTVLNILSTLSSMLATAKNWGYSSGEIALRKLVLPERNVHIPAHFTRSEVESILSLANEPWRTFFIVLALTGLRAGEALGLQWHDIDFHHKCIHIRRSAWYGKAQSTKSKASAAPVTLPDALAEVLRVGCLLPETTGLRRATTSWSIGFGQSSTRSIFRGAAFMLSGTPLRPSSWTQATRQRSQNNSSVTLTLAQR
jgi:integrase